MEKISPGQSKLDLSAVRSMLGWAEDTCEVCDRATCNSTVNLASQTLLLSYFSPLEKLLVSKIAVLSGGTPQSLASLVKFGLLTAEANGDVTPVAKTASDPTALSVADTLYERSFVSGGSFPDSYLLEPTQRYAVGVLVVTSGTAGTLRSTTSGYQATGINPKRSANKSGQSDILSEVVNVNVVSNVFWARLSA